MCPLSPTFSTEWASLCESESTKILRRPECLLSCECMRLPLEDIPNSHIFSASASCCYFLGYNVSSSDRYVCVDFFYSPESLTRGILSSLSLFHQTRSKNHHIKIYVWSRWYNFYVALVQHNQEQVWNIWTFFPCPFFSLFFVPRLIENHLDSSVCSGCSSIGICQQAARVKQKRYNTFQPIKNSLRELTLRLSNFFTSSLCAHNNNKGSR